LHWGSLYAAAASYLDARAHNGRWLLRIEDLDPPREVPGAAARIIACLREFGFQWDTEIVRQSDRQALYDAALERLRARGLLFDCSCSRVALSGAERYPGHCRDAPLDPAPPLATRLRVEPAAIVFSDRVQGSFRQDVAAANGDLIVKRRDGLIAYLLAVAVDDAAQGVTHVVRGADLLDNTAAQIYLQRALEIPTPSYAHVPVLTEPGGGKLAKSARSVRIDAGNAVAQLMVLFQLLGLAPPRDLRPMNVAGAWAWAIDNWNIERVPKCLTLSVPG
jgi:glutamyl-Q tRNA(Asp) synthetase